MQIARVLLKLKHFIQRNESAKGSNLNRENEIGDLRGQTLAEGIHHLLRVFRRQIDVGILHLVVLHQKITGQVRLGVHGLDDGPETICF